MKRLPRFRGRTGESPLSDETTLPAAVLAGLLARIQEDRVSGGLQSVEAYQELFPGHEEAVARTVAEIVEGKAGENDGVSGFLEAGDAFGSYRIEAMLGQGGQGVVYRARDQRLNRVVALKILDIRGPGMSDAFTRFQREASVAARLQHPGICAVFESGIEDGVPFIAMQYVEGTSVSEIFTTLKDRSSGDTESFHATFGGDDDGTEASAGAANPETSTDLSGPVRAEMDAVLELVEQSARALHAAHEEGVVHRDIKPGNIMVRPDGSPVILDFGLAHDMLGEGVTLTRPGELFGTPAYMSPEQLLHNQITLDRRTDVWSLGVVAYEHLTYRRPFEAPTRQGLYQAIVAREPPDPRKINPAISRDLATVLETALDKDRDRRYQTALDLAEDLRRVREFEPIQARPANAWTRLKRWAQRNRAVAASLAAVLIALTVGLVVSINLLTEVRRGKEAADKARQAEERKGVELSAALESRNRALGDKTDALNRAAEALGAKDAALRGSESLRLAAESAIALPTNPGLALLLAVESAERGGLRDAIRNNALVAAMTACQEVGQITPESPDTQDNIGAFRTTSAVYGQRGDRIVTTVSGHRTLHHEPGKSRAVLSDWAQVWDGDGRLRATMEAPPGQVLDEVVLSPDGRLLAGRLGDGVPIYVDRSNKTIGFTDRVVRIWDVASGKETHVLRGHTQRVVAVRFSPDSRRVVTASEDSTARVWDASTGRELGVLDAGETELVDARFSPNGRRVLTRVSDTKKTAHYEWGSKIEWDPPASKTWRELKRSGSISPGGGFRSRDLNHVGVRLWDAESFKEIRPRGLGLSGRFLHLIGGLASCAAFTHAGDRVVVGTDNGRIIILSATDGRRVGTYRVSNRGIQPVDISQMDISHDDRRAVLVYREVTGTPGAFSVTGVASVVSLATGKEEFRLSGVGRSARLAMFDKDGRHIMVVPETTRFGPSGLRSQDLAAPSVLVFDAKTGDLETTLRGHEDAINSVSLHPDGEHLLTASVDGTARVWSTQPAPAWEKTLHRERAAISASFSPDGRRVVVALKMDWSFEDRYRFATIVDVETGDETSALEWRGDPGTPLKAGEMAMRVFGSTSVARYSPDGRRVLTLSGDRQARILEGRSGTGDRSPGRDEYREMYFAPVRLWDAPTGKLLFALEGLKQDVIGASFSPDGARILTWSHGSESYRNFRPQLGGLESAGGGSRSSGELPRLLQVWDAGTGKLTHTVRKLKGRGRWGSVDWVPGGRRLFTTSPPWIVDLDAARVYSLPTSSNMGSLSTWVSPDGRFLARASSVPFILDLSTLEDGKDAARPTGVEIRTFAEDAAGVTRPHDVVRERACRKVELNGHEDQVVHASFSPDSRLLVTASRDGTARIWVAATGVLHCILNGHESVVWRAVFSPDGTRVATVGDDVTVRLWDTATGMELLTIRGHTDRIHSVAFSLDGGHVLTASKDGTVRLWPVDPLVAARERVPRTFTDEERLRYRLPKDK